MSPTTTHTPAFDAVTAGRVVPCPRAGAELERTDRTTGLATLCIGGGMGIATIVERV